MLGNCFLIKGQVIWNKGYLRNSFACGSFQSPANPLVLAPYEPILIFSKGTMKHEGKKENIDISKKEFIEFRNSIWRINTENRFTKKHPAPFPEELVYRLLKFYTYKEDIVLDPFSGSRTVAFVSKETNRNFIYIDHCEEYLNFAKNRIETSK